MRPCRILACVACLALLASCVKHDPVASPRPAVSSEPTSVVATAPTPAPASSSAALIATAPVPPPARTIRCNNAPGGDLHCSFQIIDDSAIAEIRKHANRDRLGLFCSPGVTVEALKTLSSCPGNVVTVGLNACPDVDDLAPLAALKNLRSVDLTGLHIKTLAPLASFPLLESVIAANLHDLTDSDLQALAHKKMLTTLRLTGSASIVDIRAVDDMPALELLDLARTAVKDIEPLRKATGLKTLVLSSRVDDLKALEGLVELRHVELAGATIADLSPLKKLVHLEHLVADGAGLRDLTVLAGLKELHTLSAAHNRELSSIKPLSSLTALKSLTLADTSIKDLSPLSALPALTSLDIHNTAVVDLGPLARIKTLKKLNVSRTVAQEKIDALKKALPELQVNLR